MNILLFVGAVGAIALLVIGYLFVSAWRHDRAEEKRFAMDPVRRLRR